VSNSWRSWASMSFRRRTALVSATAVAIAVVLASAVTYVLVSDLLHDQVNSQLQQRAQGVRHHLSFELGAAPHPVDGATRRLSNAFAQLLAHSSPGKRSQLLGVRQALLGELERSRPNGDGEHNPFGNAPPGPDQVEGYQQLVNSHGQILYQARSGSALTLPVNARTRALAASGGAPFLEDARVDGISVRILAESIGGGYALQVAEQLTDVNHLLANLRLILLLVCIGGIALAALLGRLVSGTAVAPVRRLRQAIEHVRRTQDLSRRIAPLGEDEIGRLALGFNGMMDALETSMRALDASVHAQRQLVADASHELRTPVTSLRTNIEILQQGGAMDPDEHRRLLADVVEQTEELTALVNDLIDLARGEEQRIDIEEVRLDAVVTEAIERARLHAPATTIHADLVSTVMSGAPERLGRAVNNLIENAVKYSPPGEPVEIELRPGELTVSDHGPGIPAVDLPHVFDRFYRGLESRGRPGSGLGLAIVRQVVEQHGGQVSAEAAPGGGTLMRVRLPASEGPPPAVLPREEVRYSPA
jgi:two-component system, OmpR family, sensor histidine kinase MprB